VNHSKLLVDKPSTVDVNLEEKIPFCLIEIGVWIESKLSNKSNMINKKPQLKNYQLSRGKPDVFLALNT